MGLPEDMDGWKAPDSLGAFRLIEEGAAGLAFIAVFVLAAILYPVLR